MSNTLLEKLRATTAGLHDRIEKDNPAQAILDHSIDLETYKNLLLLNFQAYKHLEDRMASFLPQLKLDKAARLKSDLEAFKTTLPADPPTEVSIASRAEALGAAYVMEGSALGGMVIAKHLQQCEELGELPPQHFFNGDKGCLKDWNAFKEELARQELSPQQEEEVLAKARESFLFFESVYRQSEVGRRKPVY